MGLRITLVSSENIFAQLIEALEEALEQEHMTLDGIQAIFVTVL